jgi:hypothetical protein
MVAGIIDVQNFGSAFQDWREKSPDREGIYLGVRSTDQVSSIT